MMMHRCAPRAALLLSMVMIVGCTQSHCENDVIRGMPSPDGTKIAFVFRRHCGATTGWSTDVSVIAMRSALRSGPGNVLVVGDNQAVKVSWLGPRTLLVSGFKEPTYRNSQVDSVTIEFR
jgi:hypothetical protein